MSHSLHTTKSRWLFPYQLNTHATMTTATILFHLHNRFGPRLSIDGRPMGYSSEQATVSILDATLLAYVLVFPVERQATTVRLLTRALASFGS